MQLYLQLGGLHGLDVGKPSLFPVKKAAPAEGAPILIAPFSRLGSASEWSREQWTELVSLCRDGRFWWLWKKTGSAPPRWRNI